MKKTTRCNNAIVNALVEEWKNGSAKEKKEVVRMVETFLSDEEREQFKKITYN